MKEKYINHCKSGLFKKNIFPANVGHLSIQIKIRVKKCHFCWRYLRFSFIILINISKKRPYRCNGCVKR